jgi:hypothetical protein
MLKPRMSSSPDVGLAEVHLLLVGARVHLAQEAPGERLDLAVVHQVGLGQQDAIGESDRRRASSCSSSCLSACFASTTVTASSRPARGSPRP